MQTTILLALLTSLSYSTGQFVPTDTEALDGSQPRRLFDSNIPAADAWKLRSKVYANGGNTEEKPQIKAVNAVASPAPENDQADQANSNGATGQPQKKPEIIIINNNPGNNAPQAGGAQQGNGALTVVVSGNGAAPTQAPAAGQGTNAFGGLGGTLTAAGSPMINGGPVGNQGQVPSTVATPASNPTNPAIPNNTTNNGGTIIAQGSGTLQNGVCSCSCNCPSSGFNAAGQIGSIPQNPALAGANGTGGAAFAGFGGVLSQAGLFSASGNTPSPSTPEMKGMPPASPATSDSGGGQEGSMITTTSMATGLGSTSAVTAGAPPPTTATVASASFSLGGGATASTAMTAVVTSSAVTSSSAAMQGMPGMGEMNSAKASLNSGISFNLSLRDAAPEPTGLAS